MLPLLLTTCPSISPPPPFSQGLLGEYKQLASSRDSGAQAAVTRAEAEVKRVQVGGAVVYAGGEGGSRWPRR